MILFECQIKCVIAGEKQFIFYIYKWMSHGVILNWPAAYKLKTSFYTYLLNGMDAHQECTHPVLINWNSIFNTKATKHS